MFPTKPCEQNWLTRMLEGCQDVLIGLPLIFQTADLTNANLEGANLEGANLKVKLLSIVVVHQYCC